MLCLQHAEDLSRYGHDVRRLVRKAGVDEYRSAFTEAICADPEDLDDHTVCYDFVTDDGLAFSALTPTYTIKVHSTWWIESTV